MNTALRKLFPLIVGLALCSTGIQPRVAVAQTSGIGSDGNTRILWKNVTGEIDLWDVNAALNLFADAAYGPYPGYTPVALTVGWNDYSYVLWNYVDGTAVIWVVDPYLNYVGGVAYGPYAGWTAESLSTGTSLTELRLLWQSDIGELAVFGLGAEALLINDALYGPYVGWSPSASAQALIRSADSLRKAQAARGGKIMPLQRAVSRAQAIKNADHFMAQHGHAKTSNQLLKPHQ
jgi:hypothetical protein